MVIAVWIRAYVVTDTVVLDHTLLVLTDAAGFIIRYSAARDRCATQPKAELLCIRRGGVRPCISGCLGVFQVPTGATSSLESCAGDRGGALTSRVYRFSTKRYPVI